MAVVKAVHGHDGEVTGLVQGTQVQGAGVQSERSDATLLLGIEGLAVRQVELIEDGARVVHVATADESASACPSCGVFSTSIKGRAITHPRDVPYGEAPIVACQRDGTTVLPAGRDHLGACVSITGAPR